MTWTQVQAYHVSALSSVTTANSRLRALTISSKNANATHIALKNGSSIGATKLKVEVPNSTALTHILIPDAGIRFESGVYVSVPTSIAATLYIDGGP